MAKTLESLIKKLADSLESQPDPWFNEPCGWLYKPNFKREAQERANVIEHSTQQTKPFSWKRMVTGSPYKKRYFRLDTKKRILRYYKAADDGEVIGDIDMGTIVDVTFSKLYDAPEFAIDLMTIQKHYTLAAESHASMVKWAYAFKLAIQSKPGINKKDTIIVNALSKYQLNPNDKWLRYDFTYEDAGPLYLNVMGTCHRDRVGKLLKNSIVVISFEPDQNGQPGRSEKSGVISVGDILVGYNGIDLTEHTFNDAVDQILSAPFPKTLNFLRDTEKVRVSNRKEGWTFAYYPALSKHRRRYVEIREDKIHFHKPAPGGSALSERDAFFDLRNLVRIKPIHDHTLPKDQQYVLRLICGQYAVIEHLDEEENVVGKTKVEVLDICFPKESTMNSWRSVLVSPTSISTTVPTDPLETIDLSASLSKVQVSVLGLKSPITNKFSPREFRLSEGSLKWKRLVTKRSVTIRNMREKSLFLANSADCHVRSVKALEDSSIPAGQGYRYQLAISCVDINYDTGVSIQSNVTIGMEDEKTLFGWLQLIRDCVSSAPADMLSLVTISNGIEKTADPAMTSTRLFNGGQEEDDLVDVFAPTNEDGDDHHDDEREVIQGYLYKRLEKPGPGGSKPEYVKRWFSLKGHVITYYKSASESRSPAFSLGTIDIHHALAVNESSDSNAADNTFEIIMPNVTHVLVAEDEDDMNQWIEAASDIHEAREQILTEDDAETIKSHENNNRAVKLQDASLYSGELQMKRFNRLTQKFVWRDRFLVIAAGSVYYYEHKEDFFDENKTCSGEIPIVAIVSIESYSEARIKTDCGFCVEARVVEKGDGTGLRKYVFEAKTPELCYEWMDQLCKANGEFELQKSADLLGYESVRIVNSSKNIEKRRSLLAGSVRLDALNTSARDIGELASGQTPDTSPQNYPKKSPLDPQRRGSTGAGRGFSTRGGSIYMSQEISSPTASDHTDVSSPSNLSLTNPDRSPSHRRASDGLTAGRGRGPSVGVLTPSTAFRRQVMNRKMTIESDKGPDLNPNESV